MRQMFARCHNYTTSMTMLRVPLQVLTPQNFTQQAQMSTEKMMFLPLGFRESFKSAGTKSFRTRRQTKTWLITSILKACSMADSRVLILEVEFDPTAPNTLMYGSANRFRRTGILTLPSLKLPPQPRSDRTPAAGCQDPLPTPSSFASAPQHGLHMKKTKAHGFQLWHVKSKVQGNSISGHWDRDETEDKPHFILLTHLVNSMDLLGFLFPLMGNKLPQDF